MLLHLLRHASPLDQASIVRAISWSSLSMRIRPGVFVRWQSPS